MKSALRTYSGLLQLRTATIAGLLQSQAGIAYALKLFLIVILIAGLGRWFGLPALWQQPTVAEQLEEAAVSIREAGAKVVAAVLPALTDLQTVPGIVAGFLQDQVAPIVDQVSQIATELTPHVVTAEELLKQSSVTVDEINQAVNQADVTPAQLSALLAKADVTPAQVDLVLKMAGITPAQIEDVRKQAATVTNPVMAQLQPLLDRLDMSAQQLQEILALLSATPEQLVRILDLLSITSDQLGQFIQQVKATPDQLQQLTLQVRDEAVKAEPPIGVRPARVVNLGGQWLATPLQAAADWLLFGLVLLLVAKSLGGKATLAQHIAALALAGAPAVLLLGAYMPAITSTAGPTMIALHMFGRVIALLGVIWCAALLVKTVATAHGFGIWKTIGVVGLTWVTMYILVPIEVLLAIGYLLRG